MTEQDAYKRWHKEQRMRRLWTEKLRLIEQQVESIRLDMELSWSEGDDRTAEWLRSNPRYFRIVNDFLNLRGYRKNMEEWRLACGNEVGLYRKTFRLGWPRLWRILLRTRKMKGGLNG